MTKTEIMKLLWELSEKEVLEGNFRDAFLLCFAGNLVEGSFTSETLEKIIEGARSNSLECVPGARLTSKGK